METNRCVLTKNKVSVLYQT